MYAVNRILRDQYLQKRNDNKLPSSKGINCRMFNHEFKLENFAYKKILECFVYLKLVMSNFLKKTTTW